LIQQLGGHFKDAIFKPALPALHITLFDWVAPLIDFGQDKHRMFEQLQPAYDQALEAILAAEKPITVVFDQLKASPNTIYIEGRDDGTFKRIRDRFIEMVELPEGAKQPPAIVHSSLARFVKPIDLEEARTFLATKQISFTEEVRNFRLLHAVNEPPLHLEVLKNYPIG
jgi:hypothetical protein